MKRKKGKKTKDKELADELFAKLVRSAGKCRKCGKTYNLQCAHVISRGYMGTRYDFKNAICLCSGCHVWFTHHELEWEDWVAENLGATYRDDLKQKAYAFTNSGNTIDYEALIVILTAKVEQLR